MTELLTLDEAAAFLHISRRTLDRLIAEGRLRPTRIRVRPYLTVAELEAHLAMATRRRSA